MIRRAPPKKTTWSLKTAFWEKGKRSTQTTNFWCFKMFVFFWGGVEKETKHTFKKRVGNHEMMKSKSWFWKPWTEFWEDPRRMMSHSGIHSRKLTSGRLDPKNDALEEEWGTSFQLLGFWCPCLLSGAYPQFDNRKHINTYIFRSKSPAIPLPAMFVGWSQPEYNRHPSHRKIQESPCFVNKNPGKTWCWWSPVDIVKISWLIPPS